jgi:hypothetical protein
MSRPLANSDALAKAAKYPVDVSSGSFVDLPVSALVSRVTEEARGIMRHAPITFGEMRSGGGPTDILVYCAGDRCSRSIATSADHWLSDIEPQFVCKV